MDGDERAAQVDVFVVLPAAPTVAATGARGGASS